MSFFYERHPIIDKICGAIIAATVLGWVYFGSVWLYAELYYGGIK